MEAAYGAPGNAIVPSLAVGIVAGSALVAACSTTGPKKDKKWAERLNKLLIASACQPTV